MDNMTAVQFGTDSLNFGAGGSGNSDNDYYKIHKPWANDIGVTNSYVDYSGFYIGPGTPVTINAIIQNLSPNYATEFDVSYEVEDGSSDVFTYNDTLHVGEVDTVTFATTWTPASVDTFTITTSTALIGDGNIANDSRTLDAVVVGEVLNYEQDFENYTGNPSTIGWFGANDEDTTWFTPSSNDGSWTRDDFGNDPAISGDAARFNFYSTSVFDADWLISPPIDMTTMGPGNMLMFDIAVTPYTGTDSTFITDDDTLFVFYSTDGQNWDRANVIDYFTAADTIPPTGWHMEYNMDALNAETSLFIGFLAMDPPSAGDINLYIDNFFMGVPPAVDVAVTNLVGLPANVLPSTMVDFDVVVSNVGQDSSFADTVDVWLNGAVVSSFEYIELASGESDTISASYTAAATAGTDVVAAAIRMVTGDPNQLNDTLAVNVDVIPPVAAPIFEDFETGITGTPGTMPSGWTNEGGDDMDWTVDAGGTGSSGTGPAVDHTLGTAAGIYIYTEASGANAPNKLALVTSPYIDVSGLTNPALSFWYHMAGGAMGDLHVDVYDGMTWHLDVADVLSGPQQAASTDPWLMKTANLSGYGTVIKLRFRGITGGGWASDMAVDDVTIDDASTMPYDIIAQGIAAPVLSMIPISQPSITSALEMATSFVNQAADNTGDITLEIYDTTGTVVHTDGDIGVTLPGFSTSSFSYISDASDADSGMTYTAAIFATNFTDTIASNDTSWAYPVEFGAEMGYDQGNWDVNLAWSSPGTRTRFATRFDLLDDDILRSVRLGLGSGTATDSFSIDLYTNDADTPSVMLNRIFRGTIADAGGPSAVVNFVAPDIPLPAGDYWIVFDFDVVVSNVGEIGSPKIASRVNQFVPSFEASTYI